MILYGKRGMFHLAPRKIAYDFLMNISFTSLSDRLRVGQSITMIWLLSSLELAM